MSERTDQQKTQPVDVLEVLPARAILQDILLVVLVCAAGVVFALNLLPMWLPGLAQSVDGDTPKIFWFLSRGSALAAYWLLWLSMCSGVIITNKLAQTWPGIPPAYEVHQYTSLLGMGFALFHMFILMGDAYIHYTFVQILMPFASQQYRPTWVGIGQIAFYVWLLVNVSFSLRGRIGKKAWRLIHFASYASFLAAMIHGILSGTDSAATWSYYSYWFSGGSLLFLTIYRILLGIAPAEMRERKTTSNS